MTKKTINRRLLLKSAGAAGLGMAAMAVRARAEEVRKKSPLKFNNHDFYTPDGKFSPEAACNAYLKLMNYHGYPIFEGLRDRLWVSDYGIGQFTSVGLGAIIFINEPEGGYLGLDLYLLPGQMIPEHYHLKTEKAPAKLEGWHVRHGVSYVYGEGEPTKNMKAVIPESQKPHVTVFCETILKPGQSCTLNRRTAHHWQMGGPEGVIASEYGTYHDGDGVRHQDPNLVFP